MQRLVHQFTELTRRGPYDGSQVSLGLAPPILQLDERVRQPQHREQLLVNGALEVKFAVLQEDEVVAGLHVGWTQTESDTLNTSALAAVVVMYTLCL